MPKTEGMLRYVNVFLSLQSLKHVLNISKHTKTLEMPFDRFDSGITNDNARSRGSDLDGQSIWIGFSHVQPSFPKFVVFSGSFLRVSDVVGT